MDPDIVLVAGPMVGASSWEPTAKVLRLAGRRVHIPDALAASGGKPPLFREWSSAVKRQLSLVGEPILVAHSAASTIVAELATVLPAKALIIIDGEIPPESGPAMPGSERLRRVAAGLADDCGALPVWPDWWRDETQRSLLGLTRLEADPAAEQSFRQDLPRFNISWFDDAIDLARWSHNPVGYIQTSSFYDHSAQEAERRGWPVIRLPGTHLHPTLAPEETASAILDICRALT